MQIARVQRSCNIVRSAPFELGTSLVTLPRLSVFRHSYQISVDSYGGPANERTGAWDFFGMCELRL